MHSFTHGIRHEVALHILGAILSRCAAAIARAENQDPPDHELIAQHEQLQTDIRDVRRRLGAADVDAEAVIARFAPVARRLADRA
jgi:hypothetical protein